MSKINRREFQRRLEALPLQTHPLASKAVIGLTASWGEKEPGLCETQARLCMEHCALSKEVIARFRRDCAKLTAYAFEGTPYAVNPVHGSLPGDVLYKTGGEFGHVGIRVAGNMVAENHPIHNTSGDARGLRTINEFGSVDLIVRFKPTN